MIGRQDWVGFEFFGGSLSFRASSRIRLIVGGLTLLMVAILLAGCDSAERVRYKMTVEVETPQGLKTGYAVRELRRRPPSNSFLGQDRGSTKLIGEAVAVDLPGQQTLFALLTGSGGDVDYPSQILYRTKLWGQPIGASVELFPTGPRTSYYPKGSAQPPMLVRFLDPHDPKSVEEVSPDDLARAFGPGVKLKRITIEVTDAPVTVGVEKRLPSYGSETGFDLWFKSLKYGDLRAISKDDFQRETNR